MGSAGSPKSLENELLSSLPMKAGLWGQRRNILAELCSFCREKEIILWEMFAARFSEQFAEGWAGCPDHHWMTFVFISCGAASGVPGAVRDIR